MNVVFIELTQHRDAEPDIFLIINYSRSLLRCCSPMLCSSWGIWCIDFIHRTSKGGCCHSPTMTASRAISGKCAETLERWAPRRKYRDEIWSYLISQITTFSNKDTFCISICSLCLSLEQIISPSAFVHEAKRRSSCVLAHGSNSYMRIESHRKDWLIRCA